MRVSEAVANAHTLFPAMRRCACDVKAGALKPACANSKLGKGVWRKGPFKGLPLYSLSLEERATCAKSCQQWDVCYGNNMPFAHRFHANEYLMPHLNDELRALAKKHTDGYSVRLHVLGDFYSCEYVLFWRAMLTNIAGLHVYGFTHRRGPILYALRDVARTFPTRFVIRESDADPNKALLVANMNDARFPTCPVEGGKAESCLACGLCPNVNVKGVSWQLH